MARIMEEAKHDCSMSGITVRYQITKMPYCDFLAKYEPSDGQQARVARGMEFTSYAPIEEAQPRENDAMSQPEDTELGPEPQPEPQQTNGGVKTYANPALQ